MKRIVTIGGGTGQSTLLRYLKDYPVAISAIVSMMDNGGSTGRLREQLGVLPAGDVRRCLIALAQTNPELQQLLEYRFTSGDMNGHVVGNMLLAGLEQSQGSFSKAVAIVSHWLQIKGKVIPVTEAQATLHATLEDQTDIVGETAIDVPTTFDRSAIKKVYLSPAVPATIAAIDAIKQADRIVLTIGDLFTSVIPNLLVDGIAQAIGASTAPLIYTCNCSTKNGETSGYSVLDYIQQLEYYLPRPINYVIVNTNTTAAANPDQLVRYDAAALTKHDTKVIEVDLIASDGMNIDGQKLCAPLLSI